MNENNINNLEVSQDNKNKTSTNEGYIYVLTNPSFPQYVKIGYTDNINKRLEQLNRSECIPFAFRLYAYYKVPTRLTDVKLHNMIDKLNPNLRAIDDFNGKKRVREFYAMDAHDAYAILEAIADINGLSNNLVLVEPTLEEQAKEDEALAIRTKRSVTQLPKMDWLIDQGVVNIGDEIYVINHPEEKAIIIDSENVEYKGLKMSFNQFGCKVTGWKSIQCYAWMKITGNDDVLSDLREKKMRELKMIN